MKTLYCKNYKGIHHTVSLVMFVFALYFLGGQKQILTSFPFQLLVLAGNFFLTKWTLKASGIDDEVEKILAEKKGDN
jgi:hypothetical protein